jgi:hypothetical protein
VPGGAGEYYDSQQGYQNDKAVRLRMGKRNGFF